jgi:hypothetical protein
MTRHLLMVVSAILAGCCALTAQDKPTDPKPADPKPAERPGAQYSGMYSFLKEGEFVQVTVEDAGHVAGFVSRYGDQDSDKGAFLDQFFKTGKLDGDTLTFTTEIVHGMAYEFKGTISRGEGKKPGDEAYYEIRGTLTEHLTDVNQKTSSRSREVTFKAFPAESS